MALTVEVSVGELLDKITILEIKSERIADPAKLANVDTELRTLRATWSDSPLSSRDVSEQMRRLKAINEKLWEIEDGIRKLEAEGSFGDEFIALARAVYFSNDERAAIKRELNTMLGSRLVEEKSYADYGKGRN
jgi:hypothetical protein